MTNLGNIKQWGVGLEDIREQAVKAGYTQTSNRYDTEGLVRFIKGDRRLYVSQKSGEVRGY